MNGKIPIDFSEINFEALGPWFSRTLKNMSNFKHTNNLIGFSGIIRMLQIRHLLKSLASSANKRISALRTLRDSLLKAKLPFKSIKRFNWESGPVF